MKSIILLPFHLTAAILTTLVLSIGGTVYVLAASLLAIQKFNISYLEGFDTSVAQISKKLNPRKGVDEELSESMSAVVDRMKVDSTSLTISEEQQISWDEWKAKTLDK